MANVYIYGPLIMWFVAQFIKFSINLTKGNPDIRYLVSAGGMPSAHAAVVCSLATIALIDLGFSSPIFGVSVVLAAIVMYDSFGVRRNSGEQAQVLNKLIAELRSARILRNYEFNSLREVLGHKPLEVGVGALLGIIGGSLFLWDKISDRFSFITSSLTLTQIRLYGYGIMIILLTGIIIFWKMRTIAKNNKKAARLASRLLTYYLIATASLALLLFSAYQKVRYLDTLAAVIITWLIFVGLLAALSYYLLKKQSAMVVVDEQKQRKDRWLRKAKRK